MSSSTSVLSETLQSITVTKIRELEKQKKSYNAHKDSVFDSANEKSDSIQARLLTLHKGVKDVADPTDHLTQAELNNIVRWTHQSACDPSVPEEKLLAFEKQLRSYLDQGATKLEFAHLYSRLLTEWIGSSASAEPQLEDPEGSGSGTYANECNSPRNFDLQCCIHTPSRLPESPFNFGDTC